MASFLGHCQWFLKVQSLAKVDNWIKKVLLTLMNDYLKKTIEWKNEIHSHIQQYLMNLQTPKKEWSVIFLHNRHALRHNFPNFFFITKANRWRILYHILRARACAQCSFHCINIMTTAKSINCPRWWKSNGVMPRMHGRDRCPLFYRNRLSCYVSSVGAFVIAMQYNEHQSRDYAESQGPIPQVHPDICRSSMQ